jgi:hypothetical protein
MDTYMAKRDGTITGEFPVTRRMLGVDLVAPDGDSRIVWMITRMIKRVARRQRDEPGRIGVV